MAEPSKEADVSERENVSLSPTMLNDKGDNVAQALQLATEVVETKYNAFTFNMFRLYAVLSIAYLCGCLNGYDGSLMGGLNGMHTYQRYFDM